MAVTSPLSARALRLLDRFTSPYPVSEYLDLISPLRHGATLRGRVVEVIPETQDAATLVIKPGADWAGHLAGQYLRVGVDVDGVRHWRTYSLTSPQRGWPGHNISITVKALPDGLVSRHLVRGVRAGRMLMLGQAEGEFVLPEQAPAKALFITGGSGITPVMGMLRSRAADLADAVLVHSALSEQDVIFGDELRRLAADGTIRLIERHTDTDGMLDVAELDTLVPDWRERQSYACGPAGLLQAIEEHWDAAGLTERLHVERFRVEPVVVGEGGTVTFAGSSVVAQADGATPLLEVGEAAGVLMPHGCRMGVCFNCVSTLRSGAVRDLRNGDLISTEGDASRDIQTCVSAAAGDCTIDR